MRHVVRGLDSNFRLIALDHVGKVVGTGSPALVQPVGAAAMKRMNDNTAQCRLVGGAKYDARSVTDGVVAARAVLQGGNWQAHKQRIYAVRLHT